MTKNDIFQVVLEIISTIGVEGLSMRKIATKINCTPSSLYNHFSDKDELLNELFWHSYLKLEVDDEIVDIKEHLMYLFANAVKYREEFLFIKKNYKATFITEQTRKKLAYSHRNKEKHLEKILVYNKIRKEDCKKIHLIIIGTAVEMVQQEKVSKKDLEEVVELLCNGIVQEK